MKNEYQSVIYLVVYQEIPKKSLYGQKTECQLSLFQVKKHKLDGTRRLAAHSHLPLCKCFKILHYFNTLFEIFIFCPEIQL